MKVIYRITEISSTNPSPWGKDKQELNKVCLRSFVEAFREVKPEMYFLADHCDKSINAMIAEVVPFKYAVEHTQIGINDTMVKSYELAASVDDYVLFQECDYLYRPLIGKSYVEALQSLSIISPYDHRNFYMNDSIHSSHCHITLIGEQHFRSTERNTMTWATKSDVIKKNLSTLKRHGYLDDEVWQDLLLAGHVLWVPILSYATHMVEKYMAPGINWESLWKKYQLV